VVGSVAELEQLSGQKIDDIHKDKVDPISFPCPKCSQTMHRIPDVIDCWFESASMPYAQLHYPFENQEKLAANFRSVIAAGVDQTELGLLSPRCRALDGQPVRLPMLLTESFGRRRKKMR
jgi:isoleucyl-tRNA synthetase